MLSMFTSNEDGSATVESVLWIPFFFVIFALIADVSLMFNAQANLTRLVQDANRAYSIGLLESDAQTEAYVLARVGPGKDDENTTVDTTVTNGVINTTVSVAAGHYMSIGLFDALTNVDIVVTSQHMMES